MTNYLVVLKEPVRYSETFITRLLQHLGDDAGLLAGGPPYPQYSGALTQPGPGRRWLRKLSWMVGRRIQQQPVHDFYRREVARIRPAVVIAQFGPSATLVMDACRQLNVPLVTIFHGYDASKVDVLEAQASAYRRLFSQGAAFIAVSKAIRENLLALGAPPERTFVSPCGVDCSLITPADEVRPPVHLLAVGRFTEKKAPHLTLLAFKQVVEAFPEARLRMVGGGGLLDACKTLVTALEMQDHVTLLGTQPHERVLDELDRAYAFVQHSIKAPDGDQEGAPVSIMEAGAAGVPVVSTHHSGIPGLVQHGTTGFLVAEHDIHGMARAMKRLLADPSRAHAMGQAAARHMQAHFSVRDLSQRVKAIADWAQAPETARPVLIPQWMRDNTEASQRHVGRQPSQREGAKAGANSIHMP